jgi:DivIVA domain-containing protein
MATALLVLVVVLVVGALVFGVVTLLGGDDPGLSTADPDGRSIPLPNHRSLTEDDLKNVRFDVGLRGYRMDQVDRMLRRTSYDLGYKDEMIAVLEAEVTALRDGRFEEAELLRTSRDSAAGPQSDAEVRDLGLIELAEPADVTDLIGVDSEGPVDLPGRAQVEPDEADQAPAATGEFAVVTDDDAGETAEGRDGPTDVEAEYDPRQDTGPGLLAPSAARKTARGGAGRNGAGRGARNGAGGAGGAGGANGAGGTKGAGAGRGPAAGRSASANDPDAGLGSSGSEGGLGSAGATGGGASTVAEEPARG